MLFLLLLFLSIFPVYLTVKNIRNLVKNEKSTAIELLIFILGPLGMLMLYGLWNPLSWQYSTNPGWYGLDFHEPIAYRPVLLVLAFIALLGFAILRIRREPMPPLTTVICMSAMYIGCVLSVLFILQLSPHIAEAYTFFFLEGFLMCLFPLNFIVSSIALTRRIAAQVATSSNQSEYKSRFMKWCKNILAKSNNLPMAAFVIMWPLLVIIIVILMLFGQKPDSLIEAFTDTSDWLFSQHVSPAVEYYGAEYLCTAAATGHERIVKPLRKGVRGGRLIIVNRQLCITNAFEELLQKKLPVFINYCAEYMI